MLKLRMRLRRPSAGTVLGFAALMVALGGVGYAAIPAPDGQIHGCYLKPGLLGTGQGQLRVIDHDKRCAKTETAITWNQQGPKGDKGDKGEQGEKGEQGDACLSTDPACVGPKGDKGDACLPSDAACVGPKGDKGDRGPPGPAVAPGHHIVGIDASVGAGGRETKIVARLNLPAGRFAITAALDVFSYDGDDQSFSCELFGVVFTAGRSGSGAGNLIQSFDTRPVSLGVATVMLTSPALVVVRCNGFKLGVSGYAQAIAIH